MHVFLALTLLFAAAAAAPATAQEVAQVGTQDEDEAQSAQLRSAIKRYHSMDYKGALQELEQLQQRDDLEAGDRVLTLAYLARTNAVFRRHDQAVKTCMQLLLLRPHYTVSRDESPLIQQAMAEAQAVLKERQTLAREVQPKAPTQAPPATTTTTSTSSGSDQQLVARAPPAGSSADPPHHDVAETRPAADHGSGAEADDSLPVGLVIGAAVAGGVLVIGAIAAGVVVVSAQGSAPSPGLGRWELP